MLSNGINNILNEILIHNEPFNGTSDRFHVMVRFISRDFLLSQKGNSFNGHREWEFDQICYLCPWLSPESLPSFALTTERCITCPSLILMKNSELKTCSHQVCRRNLISSRMKIACLWIFNDISIGVTTINLNPENSLLNLFEHLYIENSEAPIAHELEILCRSCPRLIFYFHSRPIHHTSRLIHRPPCDSRSL
jgi:hypothetical protein